MVCFEDYRFKKRKKLISTFYRTRYQRNRMTGYIDRILGINLWKSEYYNKNIHGF
jgi:hypothetical protein